MGAVGKSHSLRLAIHQLPKLGRGRVPGEELRDGHPDRNLGQRAHAGNLAGNRPDGKLAAELSITFGGLNYWLFLAPRMEMTIQKSSLP
jgi:hypothetical protein